MEYGQPHHGTTTNLSPANTERLRCFCAAACLFIWELRPGRKGNSALGQSPVFLGSATKGRPFGRFAHMAGSLPGRSFRTSDKTLRVFARRSFGTTGPVIRTTWSTS